MRDISVIILCSGLAYFASSATSALPRDDQHRPTKLIHTVQAVMRRQLVAEPNRRSVRLDQPPKVLAQLATAPTITALFPPAGPIGTLITIQGTNFARRNNFIQFHSADTSFASGPINSETGNVLQLPVTTCPSYEPQCPGFYPSPGIYRVMVENENGLSNEATFKLTPP
jgi:IPT/TIG domain-containing protein